MRVWALVGIASTVLGVASGVAWLAGLFDEDSMASGTEPPSCVYSKPSLDVDDVVIRVLSRRADVSECFESGIESVPAGSTIEMRIDYWNSSDVAQAEVVAGVNLPAGMEIVDRSIVLYNETNPDGIRISNAGSDSSQLASGGIAIGGYESPRV